MEFNRINESERARHLGTSAPWDAQGGVSPELLSAALARGRLLHAIAVRNAFAAAGRALRRLLGKARGVELGRLTHRLVPRVPAGAHGPEAVNFDCAHGRPC